MDWAMVKHAAKYHIYFIFLCIPPMAWPTEQHHYYHWLVIPVAFPVLSVYNIPFCSAQLTLLGQH
jgi:hypothetical protein